MKYQKPQCPLYWQQEIIVNIGIRRAVPWKKKASKGRGGEDIEEEEIISSEDDQEQQQQQQVSAVQEANARTSIT
jgi:hypothetical protein